MPRRRRNSNENCGGTVATVYVESGGGRDLRPTLDRFAEDTSMLGFRYLHTRYKTWFRCLWGLLLIFFVGLTIYQVVERIWYYLINNPLITSRAYDTPSLIAFPTVVLCNKMQLKASSIARINPQLLRFLSQLYDDGVLTRKEEIFFIFNLPTGESETASSIARINPQLLRFLSHLYDDGVLTRKEEILNRMREFDSVELLDIYRSAHQTAEDFLLSCQFGKGNSCMDNITPVYTPHGLCFAITPNVTVDRPGPETMLSLLLNLEIYEMIPGWVTEPGIMLSMYASALPSTIQFGEGMHLSSGKLITVPINDIRNLTRFESECGRQKLAHFNDADYSRVACQWDDDMISVEMECGCVPIRSPANRHFFVQERFMHDLALDIRLLNKTACNLHQEIQCVEKQLAKRRRETSQCREDCEEVTYSTIVFGGPMDVHEVASHLPSDWEDQKEKRINTFQVAFDIIPNHRIPLVRAIQRLADEAQSFLTMAVDTLEVSLTDPNDTHVPCTMVGDQHVLMRTINQLHNWERLWKNVASYVELVFPFHLSTVMDLLQIEITADFNIAQRSTEKLLLHNKSDTFNNNATIKQMDAALSDLSLIELSMNNPSAVFGLRSLPDAQRAVIVRIVKGIVTTLSACVNEMRQQQADDLLFDMTQLRRQCTKTFIDQFRVLHQAREVATILSTGIAKQYETIVRGLGALIRKFKSDAAPKMFHWRNHEINYRQFEHLYREGGRDNHELLELMKSRKTIQTDLMEEVQRLALQMITAIEARDDFYKFSGLQAHSNDTALELYEVYQCFAGLKSKLELLRKAPFLRAEWMARVQHQVTVAKSYSPSPQYDQVNLLFVKIYFAHFKQETIVQERSYSLFLLLAEIGGTIGLYIGATLLTVAETCVFFFEKSTRHFALLKKQPSFLGSGENGEMRSRMLA